MFVIRKLMFAALVLVFKLGYLGYQVVKFPQSAKRITESRTISQFLKEEKTSLLISFSPPKTPPQNQKENAFI